MPSKQVPVCQAGRDDYAMGTRYRCWLAEGHNGDHEDKTKTLWDDQKVTVITFRPYFGTSTKAPDRGYIEGIAKLRKGADDMRNPVNNTRSVVQSAPTGHNSDGGTELTRYHRD